MLKKLIILLGVLIVGTQLSFATTTTDNSSFATNANGHFKPLNKKEFAQAKKLYFDLCSGCHGALRTGATGGSLLPHVHVVKGKKIKGMGTRDKGSKFLTYILNNGLPVGMPAWGKQHLLNQKQISLLVRYIQMQPPSIPPFTLKMAKKSWDLVVPVKDRPTKDLSNGRYLDYIGVIMRNPGEVAIVDGKTKKHVAQLKTGFALHILRASAKGRYFYAIGRDGRLSLIDLWYKVPKIVARARLCWGARSVESSKAPGYVDKYAVVGCYTPFQFAVVNGKTLEPYSIHSVANVKDWQTGKKRAEVRVASITASPKKPIWILALKESGIVDMVNYSNIHHITQKFIKANNFLHDGGWVRLPGSKEKRYFLIAANAKNQMCVIDVVKNKLIKPADANTPCIPVGHIPHPGRGANLVDPQFGSVFVTGHIGDDKIIFIGVDPKGHPQYAWKVVRTITTKSTGTLFVKTHPGSDHLWFDMALTTNKKDLGSVGVYNFKTHKLTYIKVTKGRAVHFEYNRAGNEVWISGWDSGNLYVYSDKTLKLIKVIKGDWIKTPTGKFNTYNTAHDIY